MLGHSMGGTLAISYTIRHPETLAGLILSGPLAAPGRGAGAAAARRARAVGARARRCP